MPSPPYVLVWDLDQTLVANYFDTEKPGHPEPILNKKAIHTLHLALKAKQEGFVDAILMLTNNSDEGFISYIHQALIDKINDYSERTDNHITRIFDGIRDATHPAREADATGWPAKRVEDVRQMLDELGLDTEGLANRILFFDDIPHHTLSHEIPPENYIVIRPPFKSNFTDTPGKYKPVWRLLIDSTTTPVTQNLAIGPEEGNVSVGGFLWRKPRTPVTKKSHIRRQTKKFKSLSSRNARKSRKSKK
jgi:hypothetical protein